MVELEVRTSEDSVDIDAERTRIVSLDGECLCESGYRRAQRSPNNESNDRVYNAHNSNVSLLLYNFEERRSIFEFGSVEIKHKSSIFYGDRYLERTSSIHAQRIDLWHFLRLCLN